MAKRNKTEAKPEAELEEKETEARDDGADSDVAELQDDGASVAGAGDADADKALQLLDPDAADAGRPRARVTGAPLRRCAIRSGASWPKPAASRVSPTRRSASSARPFANRGT